MIKKISSLGLCIMFCVLLSSCSSTAEKASGTFTGTFTYNPSNQVTINITANGNDKVNMQVPGLSTVGTISIPVSLSGSNVIFSYYNASAVNHMDIVSVNGSLIGTNISLTFVDVYGALPTTQTQDFTGTKQ